MNKLKYYVYIYLMNISLLFHGKIKEKCINKNRKIRCEYVLQCIFIIYQFTSIHTPSTYNEHMAQ